MTMKLYSVCCVMMVAVILCEAGEKGSELEKCLVKDSISCLQMQVSTHVLILTAVYLLT